MTVQQIVLHLSLIKHVGPATIQKIIGSVANLPTIYTMNVSDLVTLGFSLHMSELLCAGLANRQLLDEELYLLDKHAISYITLLDDAYPSLLREIHLPPAVLYIKGATDLFNHKLIAMIGSRQATAYARHALNTLIPLLVQQQWIVVSGGAIGADTMSHAIALECKGKTISVLGSGLLVPYPGENKQLFEAIAQQGAVISSFPLLESPIPGNFPARNRIIAGLSKGVVVVQAAQESGTSITARFALDQGREVFAVPGLLTDPLSKGCHMLIQQGAKLTCSAQDILDEFGEYAINGSEAGTLPILR